jgi:hypothetical protein
MGICFWAPQAPQDTEKYDCMCEGGNPDCPFCSGTGVDEIPVSRGEIAVNNCNGRLILKWFGLQCDPGQGLVGQVEKSDLPSLHARLFALQSDETQKLLTAHRIWGGWGEWLQSYLDRMLSLVAIAIAHDSTLCWA